MFVARILPYQNASSRTPLAFATRLSTRSCCNFRTMLLFLFALLNPRNAFTPLLEVTRIRSPQSTMSSPFTSTALRESCASCNQMAEYPSSGGKLAGRHGRKRSSGGRWYPSPPSPCRGCSYHLLTNPSGQGVGGDKVQGIGANLIQRVAGLLYHGDALILIPTTSGGDKSAEVVKAGGVQQVVGFGGVRSQRNRSSVLPYA